MNAWISSDISLFRQLLLKYSLNKLFLNCNKHCYHSKYIIFGLSICANWYFAVLSISFFSENFECRYFPIPAAYLSIFIHTTHLPSRRWICKKLFHKNIDLFFLNRWLPGRNKIPDAEINQSILNILSCSHTLYKYYAGHTTFAFDLQ